MPVECFDPRKKGFKFERELQSYLVPGLTTNGYPDYRWENDFVLRHLPAGRRSVLDAGGGVGVLQVLLAKRKHNVINADRDPQIADKVSKINQRFGVNIRPLKTDLRSIPLPDSAMDAVVSVSSLEHNMPADLDQIWNELIRVLRPGGLLIVTMPVAVTNEQTWDDRVYPLWRWSAIELYKALHKDNLSGLLGLHTSPSHGQYCAESYSKTRMIYPVGVCVRKKPAGLGKTAVAVFGFDRPHYLQECVNALEANEERDGLDFHYFQDGAVNIHSKQAHCPQSKVDACLAIARKSALGFNVVEAPGNRGIPIQQMESMLFLLKDLQYAAAICLVDDFKVSRYFLHTAKVLIKQFEDDPGIFSVHHGHTNHTMRAQKSVDLDKYALCRTMPSPGGWTLFRDKWLALLPKYKPYYDMVRDIDYSTRGRIHHKIQSLLNNRVTSHDAGYEWALLQTDMLNIWPVVNRCINIGEQGTHMRPAVHGAFLKKTRLHEFVEDLRIEKFEQHPAYTFTGYGFKTNLRDNRQRDL